MDYEHKNLIIYVLAFLAPGFILTWTLNMFVPLRDRAQKLMFLQFLVLSVLHYALWFAPLTLLQGFYVTTPLKIQYSILIILGWFFIIFVSPFLIGIAVGRSAQRGWLRRRIVDWDLWADTSPDWHRLIEGFGGKAIWVQVTLRNKVAVAGLYGSASFPPSVATPSSLYLQEVYRILKNRRWIKVENTAGIMINFSEIQSVEMWYDIRKEGK